MLADYSPRLEEFTYTLLERIKRNAGKAIVINELAIHYSYDVMTQLAFGESGGFVDGSSNETAKAVLSGIQKGVDAIGLLNQVPWIMTLLTTFAFLPGPMRVFNDWSNLALEKRKKVRRMFKLTVIYYRSNSTQRGNTEPDLMQHLLANTKDDAYGNKLLFAESRVIIGAGRFVTTKSIPDKILTTPTVTPQRHR